MTPLSSSPAFLSGLSETHRLAVADPHWLKTIGYAGIEHQGVLRQAEIGLLTDGTCAARTPVAGARGKYRVYTAEDMRLTPRQARNVSIVAARVRVLIEPRTAAITLPISGPTKMAPTSGWNAWQAGLVTQKAMHDLRSAMMPGTGLWLKTFDRSLSESYERFVAAQRNLDSMIAEEQRQPKTARPSTDFALATEQAILATGRYLRAGGREFQSAARDEVGQLANVSRDMSVSAGTALGGPVAGLTIAGLTRYQDIAQPGPRIYTTSGLEDAISILSTTGALKAGDAAEALSHGKKAQIAWDIALHWAADVVPEAAGQAFKSWLKQKPLDKIKSDSLSAGAAATGPSLVNSVVTAVMDKVYKIDRSRTLALGEAIEKLFTRGLVTYAVGKDGNRRPTAPPGLRPPGDLSLFDLLYIEAKHNAPLYGSVPGMDFLRRLQSAAVRSVGASKVLQPDGVLRNEGDVALALMVVMGEKKTLAERQAFSRYLTQ